MPISVLHLEAQIKYHQKKIEELETAKIELQHLEQKFGSRTPVEVIEHKRRGKRCPFKGTLRGPDGRVYSVSNGISKFVEQNKNLFNSVDLKSQSGKISNCAARAGLQRCVEGFRETKELTWNGWTCIEDFAWDGGERVGLHNPVIRSTTPHPQVICTHPEEQDCSMCRPVKREGGES